jgi:nucleoside 2-deoxyribosyltransferase
MKPSIYIAAPLFSEAERAFNERLANALAEVLEVILPQRDNSLIVDLIAAGKTYDEAAEIIFGGDLQALDRCRFLLLVLDGRAIDEGACFELGYAFAKGKRCLGLQTDPRRLMPAGNNPMIEKALERRFERISDLLAWLHAQSL